ncbi:uncharacterized protein LOC128669335 [Plodia interpunctella]|uniref:uncharacterized protein LOC128669335 n=1 Tax=Plodia interpunctella TaxID=58824 RepID=UPI002367EC73|nr:uncharacterized protein LOC128669335 [Plodia interpunctella]
MDTTTTADTDNAPLNILPPMIVNNPRPKIEAEQIPLSELLPKPKKRKSVNRLIVSRAGEVQPKPMLPLELSCSPTLLCFQLDRDTVMQDVKLWNVCKRSIYVLCCGMWDETARLGASWWCYPRTRFFLPPGFPAKITIKATPRGYAPIPYATSALQVAVAHKLDHVVGYIVIPICAKFLTFRPPSFGESG